MVQPLKVGLAGLGTVGSAVVRLLDEGRDKLIARCGRPIEVVALNARTRGKKRDFDVKKFRWVVRPGGAGARSADRRLRRSHGRGGRSGQERGRGGARRRQAGGDRQQGPAGGARPEARRAGRAQKRGAEFRSRRRRRHSDREDIARGTERRVVLRASTASSTAPAITSCRAWSRTGCRSTRSCATRSGSVMPKPIRPSTSRATTPRRSSRSWRVLPSAPGSIPRRSMSKAFPRSRSPISMRRAISAIGSSCSASR